MEDTLSLVRVEKQGPRFVSAFTHHFGIFSFEGFDFACVFQTFLGVEAALAAFGPQRDSKGLLKEIAGTEVGVSVEDIVGGGQEVTERCQVFGKNCLEIGSAVGS